MCREGDGSVVRGGVRRSAFECLGRAEHLAKEDGLTRSSRAAEERLDGSTSSSLGKRRADFVSIFLCQFPFGQIGKLGWRFPLCLLQTLLGRETAGLSFLQFIAPGFQSGIGWRVVDGVSVGLQGFSGFP